MDLSLLDSNVKAKMYNSTDAFMADAKWIQHNCIIFNTCKLQIFHFMWLVKKSRIFTIFQWNVIFSANTVKNFP